jgi:hypothetical protein
MTFKENKMTKMTVARKAFALTALVAVFAGASGSTFAADHDTKWEKNHPRREQVNNRLENQHDRIAKEVKEGEMSKGKAARLSKEDRQIRQEERLMARQNGGHITKGEQATLNQQENAVSKQIGK